MDPHAEIAALNKRLAELRLRADLGREPTPGTGPQGQLTREDARAIARDPREYAARRDEVLQALETPPPTTPAKETE